MKGGRSGGCPRHVSCFCFHYGSVFGLDVKGARQMCVLVLPVFSFIFLLKMVVALIMHEL